MDKGGSSLAPCGTFEGKTPQAAVDMVAEKQAAIMDGSFSVEINDEEPKPSQMTTHTSKAQIVLCLDNIAKRFWQTNGQ